MLKSKRFIVFSIAVVMFIALTLLTDRGVIEIATAVGIITAIYTAGETLRPSKPPS